MDFLYNDFEAPLSLQSDIILLYHRGSKFTLLDTIMAEIPGKDNYGANIKDDAFGLLAYDISKSSDTVLNAANYHR